MYLVEGAHTHVDIEVWTSPRPAAELESWYADQRKAGPGPWATKPTTPDQSHHRDVVVTPIADDSGVHRVCSEEPPRSATSGVRLSDGWW